MTIHHYISRAIAYILPDKLYLSLKFRKKMKYWIDWDNPRTFSEKLQWLKVYDKHPEYTKMVDKLAAKEYVASIIGQEYIIPTLAVYDRVEDIDFDTLPNQFVLKCTHDSGGIVVCNDKSKLDIEAALQKLRKGLKRSYVIKNKEYPYRDVPRRIIAEQYMKDGSGHELKDYKFYCFGGNAKYCQLITNRSTDETIDFYDREWLHQPFIGLNPKAHHSSSTNPSPLKYQEMLVVADKIAKDVAAPFVRIDLYNVQGRIYFGEITFFPASGMKKFKPEEWNNLLGEMIQLPERYK